jgi:hypothetical protein
MFDILKIRRKMARVVREEIKELRDRYTFVYNFYSDSEKSIAEELFQEIYEPYLKQLEEELAIINRIQKDGS